MLWLAALAPALALAAPEGLRILTPSPAQFEKIEIALSSERAPANPFDPSQVELDATIRMPSGKTITVPGFWFQNYRRSLANPAATGNDRVEVLAPAGAPEWRVRFASGETGPHLVRLTLREGGRVQQVSERSITVSPGPARGWVRASPRNRRYLEDGAGHTFFPLGQNLCMYEAQGGHVLLRPPARQARRRRRQLRPPLAGVLRPQRSFQTRRSGRRQLHRLSARNRRNRPGPLRSRIRMAPRLRLRALRAHQRLLAARLGNGGLVGA